jgi:hypothetical protein
MLFIAWLIDQKQNGAAREMNVVVVVIVSESHGPRYHTGTRRALAAGGSSGTPVALSHLS